jgi:hypothetical protein
MIKTIFDIFKILNMEAKQELEILGARFSHSFSAAGYGEANWSA